VIHRDYWCPRMARMALSIIGADRNRKPIFHQADAMFLIRFYSWGSPIV
jgi:hypothetical protein